MKLVGRTVLITGASSGIGEAVARAAHARGATVLLVARGETKLKALAAELGIRAHVYACDVGDPEAVGLLAESVRADGRSVDVLVNNAGSGRWVSIEDASPEELLDMAKVPYVAALLMTRAFVGDMIERRSGRIVTVNSGVSRAVWPGAVGYASARWALRGLDLALKSDLRGTGVGATEIVMGTVSSSYFENNPGSEEHLPKIARMVPVITPAAAAEAICRGIERGRGTVIPTAQLKWVAWSSQHMPRMNHFMLWLTGARRSARRRAPVSPATPS
ncbi:SDR family NAD(P)-dependent oxidoreductase [Actinophytocola sp.]|uniref:SDR family NAD(P)-dependent oxidoreductase n=1 Tax=Actinophytocola sp. TaxID=1872138 RepID=UPI002D45B42B|nr:SDR family NAD(P)-dependent oxidoreductase [Actinophytocola sp.]HYQ65462.1 SDR family NAD(P)-dependent oxidoreductase [Actinophytocola sp.]